MRTRLMTALALVSGACSLQAQDIRGRIDSCFEGSRGSRDLISECIARRWSSSLEPLEKDLKECAQAQSSANGAAALLETARATLRAFASSN